MVASGQGRAAFFKARSPVPLLLLPCLLLLSTAPRAAGVYLTKETKAVLASFGKSTPTQNNTVAVNRFNLEYMGRHDGGAFISLPRVEDLKVKGADSNDIPVRLYFPTLRVQWGELPVVLFVHGGGQCTGSLWTHDQGCRNLAHWAGVLVVALEYRLAPENRYPKGLNDVESVYRWVVRTLPEMYHIVDPRRVGIMGDSAGGNLCAALVLRLLRTKLERSRMPKHQVLIYPHLEWLHNKNSTRTFETGYVVTKKSKTYYRTNYFNIPKGQENVEPYYSLMRQPEAAPLLASASNLTAYPMTLIISAAADPLYDDAVEFTDMLLAAGVNVTHSTYNGTTHSFFSLLDLIPEGYTAQKEAAKAVRDALNATHGTSV